MKHLLFINGHLNTGGVERSLADILRHMDYTKYTADVLLLEERGDYLEELPPGVSVLFRDIHDTYGSFISPLHHPSELDVPALALAAPITKMGRGACPEACGKDFAGKTPL